MLSSFPMNDTWLMGVKETHDCPHVAGHLKSPKLASQFSPTSDTGDQSDKHEYVESGDEHFTNSEEDYEQECHLCPEASCQYSHETPDGILEHWKVSKHFLRSSL